MDNSEDFKIGDWVIYFPEPEKEFEIVAVSGITYKVQDDNTTEEYSVDPGYHFLLSRGGTFNGREPYKSARKSEIQHVSERR